MKTAKKKKLEAAGWKVGSAAEFLELTPEETVLVNLKLDLAARVKELRTEQNVTQTKLATMLGSSQSRVAKIESADSSVSFDLLLRSLVTLGDSRKELADVVGVKRRSASRKTTSRKGKKPTV